ncbi:hypothetical protein BOX15_Mlig007915g2 [Macrostomum lignano]|uniref:Uncharacterized protein n=2 Tax=Macrostomum lignano TaxID=282301 RepID=A0A267H0X7_9PLAT|nr:hypothetical protein BOX15_Mlig007915g1 [Macrostomum lignano]PAA91227.1 hypothetical protein BOX15_Mlig007915g2 [Macrostomum lignano]
MTDTFTKQMLESHNRYRDLHQVGPLVYDKDLAKAAQKWAETIAKKDKLEHDSRCQDDHIGENVAMKYSSERTDFPGGDFTDYWYSEIADYDFNAENQVNCGHFTQVVWKASEKVGFGRAVSSSGRVYVVGRYSPGGNYIDQFLANVRPPKDGKVRVPESMQQQPGGKATQRQPAPATPAAAAAGKSNPIGPKNPSDTLIGSNSSTRTEGGKKITTVTERYRTPDGSVYTRERETTYY